MPTPLEGFYRQAQQLGPQAPPVLVDTSFNQFNRSAFKLAIPHIPQMNDHDLAVFIRNNIDSISTDVMNNDTAYVPLLRDGKFISALIRAVSSIPIEYNTKLAMNKITYDYFISDDPDPIIKQQFLNMSRVVNRDEINRLISVGLDENVACNLALCRNSSQNERTNVKRLNFSIYYRDPTLMTEQTVVWIYEKLFTRISDLFYGTMFEVYSPQQQNEFGENFMEVYGTVGNAVLLILNNMTTENIRKVLVGYNAEWEFLGMPAVRFSLRALSEDYSRITKVANYLNTEGKTIP